MYIRYGFKGDPLYAKLGSIEDGTLGNGFIMNNYDNTHFLPGQRIFGLAFDWTGPCSISPIWAWRPSSAMWRFDVFGAACTCVPGRHEIPLLKNAVGHHLRHGPRARLHDPVLALLDGRGLPARPTCASPS
jgi:hypothetical protein